MNMSRPAVRIACVSIAIGVAVMIVSLSVVLGFKHTVRDKIVGFSSHIIVSNYMTLQTTDQTKPVNANDSLMHVFKSIKGVSHVQRYVQKQGVLKTDSDFLGVMFKGVGEEFDTSFIAHCMVKGSTPRFSSKASTKQLLISKTMADKLRLDVGGKCQGYFMDDNDVKVRPFVITGIYQTNMGKFDDVVCIADIYTARRLCGYGDTDDVTGCELMISDFDSLDVVSDHIIDNVNKTTDSAGNPLSSLTVYDLSPQTFSWLELLDLNVWIILILMVCVAGVTIVSGLLIIILERTSMIGLMKALGARDSTVRKTFRWLALFIVAKGMIVGNILGIGICLIQKHFGIVKLDAAVYYVKEAPVEINIPLILLLNIATLLITIMALVVPSYFIAWIHPAKAMRIE